MSSKILCSLRGLMRQPVCARVLNTIVETQEAQEPKVSMTASLPASPILHRELPFLPKYESVREAWVENIDTPEEVKLGLVPLHPDVFGAHPRIDILNRNVHWQMSYRRVSYAHTKTRAEVRGGGRKPWPQKGLGRARHGSIRSPLWRGGGIAHGPRAPTTYFYMLPFHLRLRGLITALSTKLAQDDLHIIHSLDLPSAEPAFVENLLETRLWGPSVLIVDTEDVFPENIALATDKLGHVNLMPVYALNVYSMLKHSTLVLTLRAVDRIEERILFHLHRTDAISVSKKYRNGSCSY